jgi:hypothetical protein
LRGGIEAKKEVSENRIINPKKQTVQPRDAFEDTAFQPGFEVVKF